jgi:NADPH:quinone reductase-like Zn-dependent oxidoreductase
MTTTRMNPQTAVQGIFQATSARTDGTMWAVRAHSSEPASMTIEVLPRPTPRPDEVLVAVRAAAVTNGELTWPETWPVIPAHDVSGVVSAVGADVTAVHPGEEVCGLIGFERPGAAAEYVCVPSCDLAAKPACVDHLAAAALPLGGLTAWQALFDHAHVQPGEHVLVHGGAGGVGGYAVQLAAHHGARVTATASAYDADLVASLGANSVIDYAGPFEDQVADVDVVIDTVGGDTLARSWGVLHPDGILIGIAESPSEQDATAAGVRCAYFVVEPNGGQLEELTRLLELGVLRPAVRRVLELADATTAFTAHRGSHTPGKTVIRVGASE